MTEKEKIELHLSNIVQSVKEEVSNFKPYKTVTIRYCPEELMDIVFTGTITKQELYEVFCKIIFKANVE